MVGKADVWDSGRIVSGQSVAVPYAGPSLAATTRYFWKVLLWDQDEKLSPESPVSWWETGLLKQPWNAQWVSFETGEEAAVRKANALWITSSEAATIQPQATEERIAYRLHVDLAQPIRHATLFVTAEDTASAWVNGHQVLKATPLPGWKQLPWKKYVAADVSQTLKNGGNTLAVESTTYIVNPNGMTSKANAPMSQDL